MNKELGQVFTTKLYIVHYSCLQLAYLCCVYIHTQQLLCVLVIALLCKRNLTQLTCFVTGISTLCMLTDLCIFLCRESEQNFEETHDRLKRGDMVGVTGKPGRGVV